MDRPLKRVILLAFRPVCKSRDGRRRKAERGLLRALAEPDAGGRPDA